MTSFLLSNCKLKRNGGIFMVGKKLLKSEEIRIKNAQLRAKGKDPLNGWDS